MEIAAELPAAPRLVERRPRPQRRRHGDRRRHRRAAALARRHRPDGRSCATAGSSRAAPAASRCSSSGRSACCSRRRCRSASATCSAASSRSSSSCSPTRRRRRGPKAGRSRRARRRGGAAGADVDDRALDHRPRPARAVPGRLHDRHAGLAPRRAGDRRGAHRRRDDDAVDRAQLRTDARVLVDDAAGVAGARHRHRRGDAAEPRAATRRRRLRPDRAHRAGDAGRAGTRRSVLRAEPARLGAGPLHPLPRRGPVGRLVAGLTRR